MNIIEVNLRGGERATWEANKGEWDNYSYCGDVFVIMKNGEWVGIYNMDVVHSVIVK